MVSFYLRKILYPVDYSSVAHDSLTHSHTVGCIFICWICLNIDSFKPHGEQRGKKSKIWNAWLFNVIRFSYTYSPRWTHRLTRTKQLHLIVLKQEGYVCVFASYAKLEAELFLLDRSLWLRTAHLHAAFTNKYIYIKIKCIWLLLGHQRHRGQSSACMLVYRHVRHTKHVDR